MLRNIPVQNPTPDSQGFIDILMGRSQSKRTPLVEYIVDDVVMKPIVTELLGRQWIAMGSDRESQQAYLDNFIQFWYRMGYDFVRFEEALPLHKTFLVAIPTSSIPSSNISD